MKGGVLLPFGGYKGYGFALMVENFVAVLSGEATPHNVHAWNVNRKDLWLRYLVNKGTIFLLVYLRYKIAYNELTTMSSKSRDITRKSLGIVEYDDAQRLIKPSVSSAKITLV